MYVADLLFRGVATNCVAFQGQFWEASLVSLNGRTHVSTLNLLRRASYTKMVSKLFV